MYLLSLNNSDYVFITIFFAVIALIAYAFRRKNKTGNNFLFTETKVDGFIFYLGGFGILEIALASFASSQAGFSVLYIGIIIMFFISFLFANLLSRKYKDDGVTNFNDYVYNQLGSKTSNLVAVMSILMFIALAIIAEGITFELLHALLGWSFVNSVIGVMGLILISLIIGGVQALKYNNFVQTIIILAITIITIIFVTINTGYATILGNLETLAVANQHAADFYTTLHFTTITINSIILFLIAFGGFYCINFSLCGFFSSDYLDRNNCTHSLAFLSKIFVLMVLMLLGILAIGTKGDHKSLPNGREVVTIQAQLPDGQTGYIVKTIDSNSSVLKEVPGLIPPMLDIKTGIAVANSYDYNLASVVVLRQYLPKCCGFLLAIFVLSGFILAFSNYILHAARVILRHIIIPNKIFEEYGDVREIWVLRVSILVTAIIATASAIIYLPYFVFIQSLYFVASVLLAPLFATVILSLVSNGKVAYIAILMGVIVAISMVFIIDLPNDLHKYSLITLIGFLITFVGGLILNGIEKMLNEKTQRS